VIRRRLTGSEGCWAIVLGGTTVLVVGLVRIFHLVAFTLLLRLSDDGGGLKLARMLHDFDGLTVSAADACGEAFVSNSAGTMTHTGRTMNLNARVG
jgi:hypothetical protein